MKPVLLVNSSALKLVFPHFDILNLQRWMANISTQESKRTNELAFEVFVVRIQIFPDPWSDKNGSTNHGFADGSSFGSPRGFAASSRADLLECCLF
jgi:hypothetical protein